MARRGHHNRRGGRHKGGGDKDSFGGFIAPATLLEQVRSAAPWLLEPPAPPQAAALAASPLLVADADDGYLRLLRRAGELEPRAQPDDAAWCAYFALCLGAHFASVATYVPTDVDTKIRDHLWFAVSDDALPLMCAVALAIRRWDVRAVTARGLEVPGLGFHSGHDGERLSVWTSGHLRCLAAGRLDLAAALADAVDAELRRESAAFLRLAAAPPADSSLLRLAAIVTHNVGDVDQGLSAKGGAGLGGEARAAFARLAHERGERYGGAFVRANALYQLVAADGHRHYPLREVRALRQDRRLLLPIAPFLEGWGETLATFPPWSSRERAAAAEGLIAGCERVPGQQGYYRALHGMHRATRGGLPALGREMAANRWRRAERDRELWQRVEVSEQEFCARLNERAAALLR